MSPSQDSIPVVNPPRKAKRLRELASREYMAELAVPSSSPPPSVQQALSPQEGAAGPRRRGRKPAGPMSRAAREQLRKTNHSVIEKRRREKINEALAALRELVPNQKPEGEEKEFKLEVLVRTVEYLQLMVDKVRNMEDRVCTRCRGQLDVTETSDAGEPKSTAVLGKRLRPVHDLDSDDLEEVLHEPCQPSTSTQKLAPLQTPPSLRPHLPSISSWMLPSPTESPTSDRYARHLRSPPQALQLPSPPCTVQFPPTSSTGSLPRLALPPGMQLPPTANEIAHLDSGGYPFSTSQVRRTSRPAGSLWSRDDQTAASLLLNISSRPALEVPPRNVRGTLLEAQTPSSVLGMADGHQ